MNVFDIITLVILAVTLVICAWKGLLKIALKLGAFVISAIVAKFAGPVIGNKFIPALIKDSSGTLDAATLEKVNTTISGFVGTVLLFIVLVIVLKLIAGLIAKAVTKITHTGKVDHILGGVVGIIVAAAFVYVIAEVMKISASVVAYVSPSTDLFAMMEESVIFKYFL